MLEYFYCEQCETYHHPNRTKNGEYLAACQCLVQEPAQSFQDNLASIKKSVQHVEQEKPKNKVIQGNFLRYAQSCERVGVLGVRWSEGGIGKGANWLTNRQSKQRFIRENPVMKGWQEPRKKKRQMKSMGGSVMGVRSNLQVSPIVVTSKKSTSPSCVMLGKTGKKKSKLKNFEQSIQHEPSCCDFGFFKL